MSDRRFLDPGGIHSALARHVEHFVAIARELATDMRGTTNNGSRPGEGRAGKRDETVQASQVGGPITRRLALSIDLTEALRPRHASIDGTDDEGYWAFP